MINLKVEELRHLKTQDFSPFERKLSGSPTVGSPKTHSSYKENNNMVCWKAIEKKIKTGTKVLKNQSSQSVRRLGSNPNPIILKKKDIILKSRSPESSG